MKDYGKFLICMGLGLLLWGAGLATSRRLFAQPQIDLRWSSNVPLTEPSVIPRDPDVALDAADGAWVVWVVAGPAVQRGVYLRTMAPGQTWEPPIQVPGSSGRPAHHPRVEVQPEGAELVVAWASGLPETRADVLVAWAAERGTIWQGLQQVNTDPDDIVGQLDLVRDVHGNLHLVWSDLAVFGDRHTFDIKWSVRLSGHSDWTPPAILHPDVVGLTEQSQPALAATPSGDVWAIWHDTRHGPDDPHAIYAARWSAQQGGWEPGRRVDQRPGQANVWPDLAAAPDGTLYAVWRDAASTDVYAAIWRPAEDRWQGPFQVNRPAARRVRSSARLGRNAGESDMAPRVSVDRLGRAFAVWQDLRAGQPDIYSAVWEPGAVQWSPNVVVNDDLTETWQTAPALAAGLGRVMAAWVDFRPGETGAIYAADYVPLLFRGRLPLVMRRAGGQAGTLPTAGP